MKESASSCRQGVMLALLRSLRPLVPAAPTTTGHALHSLRYPPVPAALHPGPPGPKTPLRISPWPIRHSTARVKLRPPYYSPPAYRRGNPASTQTPLAHFDYHSTLSSRCRPVLSFSAPARRILSGAGPPRSLRHRPATLSLSLVWTHSALFGTGPPHSSWCRSVLSSPTPARRIFSSTGPLCSLWHPAAPLSRTPRHPDTNSHPDVRPRFCFASPLTPPHAKPKLLRSRCLK